LLRIVNVSTQPIFVRATNFHATAEPDPDARVEFQRLYEALASDDVRNRMICDDVVSALNQGRSPLLLTERTEHLRRLAELLSAHVMPLQGGMGTKELRAVLALLADGPSTPADAEGENRARSATEAFLFGRLETLPETSGRFRLNVELPIPFDGWGRMEVDLLCADAGVVVELDGAQHLADAEAYRRDRRNWPKSVFDRGHTARQTTGRGYCFEFVAATAGQTERYGDPNSFIRAFREWEGKTSGEWKSARQRRIPIPDQTSQHAIL
jgi:hypothetical protein